MRGNCLKLQPGRFRLDIRNNFFTESGQVLEQGSGGALVVFKRCVDMAPKFSDGTWLVRLMVGLEDLF